MSQSNRKRQRDARALAKAEGLPYQEALRRLNDVSRAKSDHELADELERFFDESAFSLSDIFSREIVISDEWLAAYARAVFAGELAGLSRQGGGVMIRAAQLLGIEPPRFHMPDGYGEGTVAAAWSIARGYSSEPDDYTPGDPHEAAGFVATRPRAVLGVQLWDWLRANSGLAASAVLERPVDLAADTDGWGRSLIRDLDDIPAGRLLDSELVNAVRNVFRRHFQGDHR